MNRNITNTINWMLDNFIPPLIRDSRLFMYPLMWLLLRDKTKDFMDFKRVACNLSAKEIGDVYRFTADRHIKRATDLNSDSVDFILKNVSGSTVLDIACGSGYLSELLADVKGVRRVVGVDFDPPTDSDRCQYISSPIEDVEFEEGAFDTVISAHTIEHLTHPAEVVDKLRLIAKRKLIIVVPRQRKYKYTFDLHLQFFPYEDDLISVFRPKGEYMISLVGGDWLYVEKVGA